MSRHNTLHQIFHYCLLILVMNEREYVDNLLLLDLELNGWFFELEILDQFEIGTRFQVGEFLSIWSVFKEVSSLFQDLTMTLSGCFREFITGMLVASSDRKCSWLV